MKYLDERIIVTVSGLNISESNTYVYEIRKSSTILFVGNIFLESGSTTKDIDITNIIENDKWVATSSLTNIISTYFVRLYVAENSFVDSNSVMVAKVYRYPHYISTMNNTLFNYTTESGISRVMLQGYNDGKYKLIPHYPMNDNFEIKVVTENSNSKAGNNLTYTVEGAYEGSRNSRITSTPNKYDVLTASNLNITPFHTYQKQLVSTNCTYNDLGYYTGSLNQYDLDVMIYDMISGQYKSIYNYIDEGAEVKEISFSYRLAENELEGIAGNPISIVLDDGGNRYYINLQLQNVNVELLQTDILISFRISKVSQDVRLISDITFKYELSKDKETVLKIGNEIIGKFDVCPSPFYLVWQDRFGSFQSQPFNSKNTYSESYNKSEVVNYYNVRRLSNVQIQPKWKINSDWISEDLYPYYESLFVSPILILYDSVEGKSYEVMVTGDYTEKTFRNQKQLLNLSLDLKLSEKQNITY